MTTQYSTVQKLSLAGTVIGALMCVVGGIAPYWIVFDLEAPGSLSFLAKLANEVYKMEWGLFICCQELLGERACNLFCLQTASGGYQRNELHFVSANVHANKSNLSALPGCSLCCWWLSI